MRIFSLLACFLCSLLYATADKQYALAICAVFQNESFFLKEWIAFHRLMGADHFYLYNNLSTDDYWEVLEPYVEEGLVELFHWPVETSNQKEYLTLLQLPVYNHALRLSKQTAQWAAFIDLDEFLCPMRHDSLVAMLQEYRDCAGLLVNWQTFGTSHIERLSPGELIIENFIWKAPAWWEINKHVKLIVQPDYADIFKDNPHYCQFKEGYYPVNGDKKPISHLCQVQPLHIDAIRIHHYWFGDRNWFLSQKRARRKAWGTACINPDYLEQFIESFNQEKDEAMLRFVPQLKKELGLE
ncbi:MAG TPA: glycosyltransferase family 92 protein [Rhabdochlamydiaceae bacterium]|jgi:hypothetical protein